MYYQESATSIENDTVITESKDDSLTPSLTRDSVITYTTDLEDSSVLSSGTDLDHDTVETMVKRKSSVIQQKQQQNVIPFYSRRRFWAVCIAFSVILSAIFIPLLFLVIIPNVAQNSVNKSTMDFDAINITNPTNDSFTVSMSGATGGTGPFSAKITFNGPVQIVYKGSVLGTVDLNPILVSNGKGSLGGASNFTIGDNQTFNEFSSQLVKEESFEWTLQGSANVRTLGININNLNLDKTIKIPGSNNFNTTLLDLKLTENPDKTYSLEALTNVYNPSPIGIEIGDMTTQLKYGQTLISTVTAKNVFIGAKNNYITLTGITTLPVTDQDKSNLITVINGYLSNTPVNTTANIISVVPKNGPVSWINSAVQGLSLSAVVGNNPNPPKLITNIDLGDGNLKFTPDDPYSPTISSKNAVAGYTLPFNISFKILEIGQKITLATPDNTDIVTIESPEAPVIDTNSQIFLNISETKMQVLNAGKFSDFLLNLTKNKEADVIIHGKTDILTNIDVLGQVPIQGLPFNVTTKLQGFDQFNSDGSPPSVGDLTILSGTSSQLYLGVVIILTNPSKYSTSIGQVTFDLFYKENKIGTTVIPDLSVVPGPNPVSVVTILDDPENNDNTKDLFKLILTQQSVTVNIKGNEKSTNITSLIPAFKAIDIPSTIPPLNKPFLQSAKIVLDDQTAVTNYSTAVVEISNPFETPISIYTMNSTYSFNGTTLGSLEQDIHDNPIFIPGKTVLPRQFPVKMVIDPVLSFTMLRTLALQNNLDVSVLDTLIALSNVTVPGVDVNAKPTQQAIASFDLAKFVTTALANIPLTIDTESQVAIGDYFMTLTYKQNIVANTDESILKLIPALATPLISHMVDQTQMIFDSVFIQNIDVASFDTLVSGQILNVGPLPATISFPDGANVYSDNILLGKILTPPVTTDPLSGTAKFNNVSKFIINDIPTFASFSAYSYVAESVNMEISSDNVMITTFGLPIGPVSIKKQVQVDGLNGLKQFTIGGVTFPFAITININNPTRIGIELGKVVYSLSIEGEQISTITSNSVIINPKSVNAVTFQGDLNLTDPVILKSIVSKPPPQVTAQGISVTPPKATGEVAWLSETVKSFTLTAPLDPSELLNGKGPAAPADPGTPAVPGIPATAT